MRTETILNAMEKAKDHPCYYYATPVEHKRRARQYRTFRERILSLDGNAPKRYSMLDDELACHPFHCPKCGSHLTSLFLCGECNIRYVEWANLWGENQRLRRIIEKIKSGMTEEIPYGYQEGWGYLLPNKILSELEEMEGW